MCLLRTRQARKSCSGLSGSPSPSAILAAVPETDFMLLSCPQLSETVPGCLYYCIIDDLKEVLLEQHLSKLRPWRQKERRLMFISELLHLIKQMSNQFF